MKKKFIVILLACFVVALFAESVPIKMELHWFPQAQFAGFIMAYEQGMYEDAGIDMQLSFSDGVGSPLTKMLDGEIDFCTAWLSQTIALKSEGADILNFCQVLQKSSLMLVSKKESGIEKPEDMKGKKISLWSGDFTIQPKAFFNKFQIDYIPIKQSYNIYGFLAEAWDVASAMYYNEYYKMILSGANEDELNKFFFSDYDLNFPEDGIYTTNKTYTKNPELTHKICEISLKGWEFAFQNEEETLITILKYCDEYKMQTNYAAQKWMLNVIEESIKYQTGEKRTSWGNLKEDDYYKVAEILKQQGIIKKIPTYSDFYRSGE
ncbi:MAG: ABC transporter substrate-binding protein [Candidatus Cloacimonetes bacterium]|nr:ABC transporter substrate-binding protein [Candidatus Cloacimonadota bacterium]MCF7813799.1 ABC transporter substrate-binding protein [Candidatus Cloacimonadota bacterium]MCF7868478.1 ABC transporter substrate-binding protein [Candidatus Cloacimonadota bacterium]